MKKLILLFIPIILFAGDLSSADKLALLPRQIYEGQDTTGGLVVSDWVNLPLYEDIFTHPCFSHTPPYPAVTINTAGVYKIMARITTHIGSGNKDAEVEMRILHNETALNPLSTSFNVSSGEAQTMTLVTHCQFSVGDSVRVQIRKASGQGTVVTCKHGSSLILESRNNRGGEGESFGENFNRWYEIED